MALQRRNIFVLLLVCVLTVIAIAKNEEAIERTTVTTDAGTFVGYIYKSTVFGENLSSRRFLKIPYARPPVGDLRFRKPMQVEKIEQPYDATQYGPACAQQFFAAGGSRKPGVMESITVSEDCLFLNIYTPNTPADSQEKLPVMIYFHPGCFVTGGPNFFAGDVVASYGNVIWITVAYRLSIWGFLSTGDKNLPGNYGLWDQRMAIQWVHDNIASFNGDPESITLIGTSAGGASVIYQSMFPGNKGLVKRGIAMSGSVKSSFAFNANPLPSTKRFGELIGCDGLASTEALADCLRSKSSEEMSGALHDKNNEFVRWPLEFLPTVDNDFIQETTSDLFGGATDVSKQYQAAFASVDLITGVVSGDGLVGTLELSNANNVHEFEVDRQTFEHEIVSKHLYAAFRETVPDIVRDAVIHEYTNWDDPENKVKSTEAFINFYADYAFNIHNFETAFLHAKISNKNTYVYLYDAFIPRGLFETPSWARKVQHVGEMTTLLGHDTKDGYAQWLTPYVEEEPEQWEVEMMKAHITMWTNFAKSGNPNEPEPVTPYINTTWPEYDVTSQRHLTISRDMCEQSVGRPLSARAANFWHRVLPGLMEAVRAGPRSDAKDYCESEEECGHG